MTKMNTNVTNEYHQYSMRSRRNVTILTNANSQKMKTARNVVDKHLTMKLEAREPKCVYLDKHRQKHVMQENGTKLYKLLWQSLQQQCTSRAVTVMMKKFIVITTSEKCHNFHKIYNSSTGKINQYTTDEHGYDFTV